MHVLRRDSFYRHAEIAVLLDAWLPDEVRLATRLSSTENDPPPSSPQKFFANTLKKFVRQIF